MLESFLLTIAWGLDPGAIEPGERQATTMSAATIVRPAALLAEPRPSCAFSTMTNAKPILVSTRLKRWEQATQNSPEMTRSQKEEFRRRLHVEFNAHTAAAVEQLLGRIDERRLAELYEWRIAETNGDLVCLEAIPKDSTEQLFYGSLRVWLHAANGTAEKIVVVSRNQIQRIVWRAEGEKDEHDEHPVQLVQFEDDVPPAPSETLRTANSRLEQRK